MFSAIVEFVSNVGSTVVNWLTGSGGDAVQAVAGEALEGAVTGALIGAAAAAIQGEDISKGALYGAAAGGVAGGAKGIWDQMTFDAPEVDMPSVPAENAVDTAPVSDTTGLTDTRSAGQTIPRSAIPASQPATPPEAPPTKGSGLLSMSDNNAKMVAGIGQGAAQGALEYLSAKETADAQKENQERQWAREDEVRNEFAVGKLPTSPQIPKVEVKTWWQKHLNPQTGLISTKGVA